MVLRILATLAFVVASVSTAQSQMVSDWLFERRIDAFTDENKNLIAASSLESRRAGLVVGCDATSDTGVGIILRTGQYISSDSLDFRVGVRYDQGEPVMNFAKWFSNDGGRNIWLLSDEGEAELFENLKRSQRVVFRVTNNHATPVTLEIPVEGFETALDLLDCYEPL